MSRAKFVSYFMLLRLFTSHWVGPKIHPEAAKALEILACTK